MTDTCGSYRTHGGCSDILMSEVLGESAGAFCVKMCVAALLAPRGQREFDIPGRRRRTPAPSPAPRGLTPCSSHSARPFLRGDLSCSASRAAQATVDGERQPSPAAPPTADPRRRQIVPARSRRARYTSPATPPSASPPPRRGGPRPRSARTSADPTRRTLTSSRLLYATVLIVVTLQALIHLDNVVHMAKRKRTGRHQRASCVCAVFLHQDPGACVRYVLMSSPHSILKYPITTQSPSYHPTSHSGLWSKPSRPAWGKSSASEPPSDANPPLTNPRPTTTRPTRTSSSATTRTRRAFVEVTMTAAVPLTMGGGDPFECVLSTRTVVSARVDESRRAHVGEPGAAAAAARRGMEESSGAVDGGDGNEGPNGNGGVGPSRRGSSVAGKRHGGAATLEDVDPHRLGRAPPPPVTPCDPRE